MSDPKVPNNAAELREALQAVKAALDAGTLIADPTRLRKDPSFMFEHVKLLNQIILALHRAKGDAP